MNYTNCPLKCTFYLPQILLPKNVCYLFIKKVTKNKIISMFHRKKNFFMRKRRKSHIYDCDKNAQILHLEELICHSHTHEKSYDEEIAVTKIN